MKDVESLLISNITKIAQEAPKPIPPVATAQAGSDNAAEVNPPQESVPVEPSDVDRFDRLIQSIDSLTGILNRAAAGVPTSLQSASSILQMMKGDVVALKDFYG